MHFCECQDIFEKNQSLKQREGKHKKKMKVFLILCLVSSAAALKFDRSLIDEEDYDAEDYEVEEFPSVLGLRR